MNSEEQTMNANPLPVTVAVDGTDLSAGAIAYAVREARTRRADLRVVHVSPAYLPVAPLGPMVPMMGSVPPLLEETSRRILADICAGISAVAPDVHVRPDLRRGPISGSILDASEGAGLLIVGQETRTGIDRLAAGATTLKVAARAACQVVAVPAPWQPGPLRHRLVVGVRSGTHAADLLAQAFELAEDRNDTLVVLHAWHLADPYLDRTEARTNIDQWTKAGEALLEELLAESRQAHPDVRVEAHVVHQEPANALVEAGRNADLILLARRTRDPLHISRLGGTARAVLQHAPCPVLVLSAHAEPEPEPELELELEQSGRLLR
jgi:nucleotide-binding universal stress UspA family protein